MFASYLHTNFDKLQQINLSSKDKVHTHSSGVQTDTSNPHSQDTTFDEELLPLSSPKSGDKSKHGRPPRIRHFSHPLACLTSFLDIWDQIISKLDDHQGSF